MAYKNHDASGSTANKNEGSDDASLSSGQYQPDRPVEELFSRIRKKIEQLKQANTNN